MNIRNYGQKCFSSQDNRKALVKTKICEKKMKELLEHSNWHARVKQIQFKEMLQKILMLYRTLKS